MHILQLLPALRVGGVERGVLDITKGLVERGHRVSVVSSGGPLVERLNQLGAKHYELPVHEKSLVSMWRCIPELSRIITQTNVDIVHARSRVPAWIGLVACRQTQRPFITTAHGFYKPHLASRVMVWGRLVIVPSNALGNYLIEQFRLPKWRIRVIPRGIDLNEFQFSPPASSHEGSWKIGLFSRLSAIKGQEIALRAIRELIKQNLSATLYLTGDVPGSSLQRQLESLIAKLKLQNSVKWCEIRQDVASMISLVDMVVVPSTYPESFGRGVIEAQAVGRPVVASRIGGLAELIEDGHTGLSVPAGDATALAKAIKRLIQDDSLRAKCIQKGRERIESEFGLDRMVERTLGVYEECIKAPRVLIWKMGALGDVVLATPSIRAIRNQFPEASITLAVGRSAYEVVAHCPYLDDIIIFDPRRKERSLFRRLGFIRRLRECGFDLSIDLQNSRTTHLLAWLSGIPVRVGYRRKYGWMLNRGVRLPRVILSPVAHQHYLLRKSGLKIDTEALEVWPSPSDEEAIARLISTNSGKTKRQIVGLHPGGSGRWKTKRWDLSRWARLCDELMRRNIGVIITGGPDEESLGDAFIRDAQSEPLVVIGRTSVLQLACLIKRCDAFIAHDSSPLHLATAVGTPAIALFGPTDPARHLSGGFNGQVIKKDVFCSPCYSTYCCTISHTCMNEIGVEEVLSGVLGLLAET